MIQKFGYRFLGNNHCHKRANAPNIALPKFSSNEHKDDIPYAPHILTPEEQRKLAFDVANSEPAKDGKDTQGKVNQDAAAASTEAERLKLENLLG